MPKSPTRPTQYPSPQWARELQRGKPRHSCRGGCPEIVHALRLGEAQRAAHEPFNPSPQIDVFALDFLRVLLAHLMLLSLQMPLVGPPAVGVKLRDTKRCQ